MKKIYFLVVFFAICCYVLISDVNNSSVSANIQCEVSFHFDGLQAIAFGDSKRVSDGILDVHHHNPLIEIKEIKQGKGMVIRTVKADELKGKVLNVDIPNTPLQPTRYYSPDMTKDSQDFRWCLDIENDLFQKQLYLKDEFFAKIHFNTGTFYAENLTADKYQFVAGSKIHNFKREIARPNGKVLLSKGQNLVISGLNKTLTLAYQPGTNYSVDITNLPTKDMMNMDHFAFYYDLVKTDVPKYMPVMVKKASFAPHPMVCESIIFGKSTIK
ncbi:MAG: hypothetical protein WAQ98_01785 [Blastocatellia bacterium]